VMVKMKPMAKINLACKPILVTHTETIEYIF